MQQNCDLLLQAQYIVTQDEERRVLEDAAIAICDGIIVGTGTTRAMREQWQPAAQRDLGRSLIMPGLVNTHTHVAMTFLRGLADDLPLMQWLTEHIFPVEQHLTPEIVELCSMLGQAEMLRTGTTACMDMYLMEDSVFRAALRTGIRCQGAEAVFNFPGVGGPGGMAMLDIVREQAEAWKEEPRIGVHVCPHAVYTTTPELLQACAKLAEELDLPMHLHLAETRTETAECLKLWGKRPVPYCRDLGLLRPGVSLAHVVDVTEEEMDILAECGVGVAHNPSSNMKLASGIARIPAMQSRGITVGLGTDGAASNNRLNMFTEMGRAALMHKAWNDDPTCLPAQKILDMGTRDGGILFAGRREEKKLGILAPGHPADLIALDLDAPNMQPLYNAASHLAYAATGMEVRLTMVEGEVLYDAGKYTRFDYKDLLGEIQKIRRWVLEKHA